jgi:hypothetical protein
VEPTFTGQKDTASLRSAYNSEILDQIMDVMYNTNSHPLQGLVQLFWAEEISGAPRIKQKILGVPSAPHLGPTPISLVLVCVETFKSIVFLMGQGPCIQSFSDNGGSQGLKMTTSPSMELEHMGDERLACVG